MVGAINMTVVVGFHKAKPIGRESCHVVKFDPRGVTLPNVTNDDDAGTDGFGIVRTYVLFIDLD